jgi:hypothetical protein
MPTLQYRILVRARAIIIDEKDWTFGTTRQRHCKHTRYCAFGAILQATKEITGRVGGAAVLSRFTMQRLVYVNDNLGHSMVLKYLDELIEEAYLGEYTKPTLTLVHSRGNLHVV